MHDTEEHFATVERFLLFTGHLGDRNLGLYNQLGYTELIGGEVLPKPRLVYLEKLNTVDEA